jgi:hypothetical protein
MQIFVAPPLSQAHTCPEIALFPSVRNRWAAQTAHTSPAVLTFQAELRIAHAQGRNIYMNIGAVWFHPFDEELSKRWKKSHRF